MHKRNLAPVSRSGKAGRLYPAATLVFLFLWGGIALGAEDWKGKPPVNNFTVGATAGLGIVDSAAGFSVLGSAAYKILNHGFVPDINDQVFAEFQMGPLFVNSLTTLFFSFHLRWDFIKDDDWTFFALGGLGANHVGATFSTDQFRMYPRLGLGAVYALTEMVSLRLEVSHEFLGAGVQVLL